MTNLEYEALTRASNKPPKLWATKKSGRILSYTPIVSDVLCPQNRRVLVFFVISKQSIIFKHFRAISKYTATHNDFENHALRTHDTSENHGSITFRNQV